MMMPATTLFDSIPHLVDEVEKLINHYRAYEKDGWTRESVTDMIGRFVASVTRLVYCPLCAELKAVAGVAGGAHDGCIEKSTVLSAFERFYDAVVAPLNIPFLPDLVEVAYVDPAVRAFLRDQAGTLFDLLAAALYGLAPAKAVGGAAGDTAAPYPVVVSDGPLGPVLAY